MFEFIATGERPPALTGIEKTLLATLMDDVLAWDKVGDILTENHFSADGAAVYCAVGSLINACKIADINSVALHLQRNPKTRALGQDLQSFLAGAAPQKGAARQLALLIHEEHTIRQVRALGKHLAQEIESGESAIELLSRAAGLVASLQDALPSRNDVKTLDQLVVAKLDEISSKHDESVNDNLVDILFSGQPFKPLYSKVIGLCGEDSTGKTTLGAEFYNRAIADDLVSVFFTMEMPAGDIVAKLWASRGPIKLSALSSGNLSDPEWTALNARVEVLRQCTAYMDESEEQSLDSIVAKCGRIKRESGRIDLVVIDHLKFIAPKPGQTLEDIVLGLKVMARRLGCCVLLLSHAEEPLRKSADAILRLAGQGNERTLTTTKNRRDASYSQTLSFDATYGLFELVKPGNTPELMDPPANSLF